jgi:hypothetical protein
VKSYAVNEEGLEGRMVEVHAVSITATTPPPWRQVAVRVTQRTMSAAGCRRYACHAVLP